MKNIFSNLNLIIIGALCFLTLDCKKDKSQEASLALTDTALFQDSEAQDATIDMINDNIDRYLDGLEINNFSAAKSASSVCVSRKLLHPDTLVFPKTITLTYNCTDTVNGEYIGLSGVITVVTDTMRKQGYHQWRNILYRTFNYSNFTITTDSATITLNGTRTVKRQSFSISFRPDVNHYRIMQNDSITAALILTIDYSGKNTDVTRVENKSVQSITHYNRTSSDSRWWFQDKQLDTLVVYGSVKGTNAHGMAYLRSITQPLYYVFCNTWPYNPVISKGKSEITEGIQTPVEISYSNANCITTATVTKDGKTAILERRLSKKYYKWWN